MIVPTDIKILIFFAVMTLTLILKLDLDSMLTYAIP